MTKFDTTSTLPCFGCFAATRCHPVSRATRRIAIGAPALPLPFTRALPFVDDLQLVIKIRNARVGGEDHREVTQHVLPCQVSGGSPDCWACSTNRLPSWNRFSLFSCPFALLRFPLATVRPQLWPNWSARQNSTLVHTMREHDLRASIDKLSAAEGFSRVVNRVSSDLVRGTRSSSHRLPGTILNEVLPTLQRPGTSHDLFAMGMGAFRR